MSVIRFRPEWFVGTEPGGYQFPLDRVAVAKCLRQMRSDHWHVKQEGTSFICRDLLTGDLSTIRPTSSQHIAKVYEGVAVYYEAPMGA